ncbi:conserved hypothetical protein [Chlamydia felis Fe/C-56]|uniref:Effector from type III secretion system family protein n=1 Tax=Chlamydia felis (strain Fe/C-56) TaxID=264202 RepID=Q256B7_CHLFF|nr:CT620/CT621 family type III secretion system effector [Chlamydia felis]BAE80871.1 conserved hypothetical protein [Chlamydia felis Fe/C-56]
MTLPPSFLTFNRNVTAALLGDQVDMTTPFSNAVFLFQELDQKARGLKHALGLLQEAEAKLPTPQISSELSREISFDHFPEGKIAPFVMPDVKDVTEILGNPNLAAARLFIEGLNKSFDDCLQTVDNGGVFNPTAAEEKLVKEYKIKLDTLKQQFTAGSNPTEAQYNEIYALPKEFVAALEKLQGKDAPPKSKIIHFWQNIMVVYNAMTSLSYPVSKELNVQLAECSLNIDQANTIIELIRQFSSSLKDLLNPIWNVSPTASNLDGSGYNAMQGGMTRTYLVLGGVYRMLMDKYATQSQDAMSEEVRAGVTTFINALQGLKVNNSVNLANFLSLQYAYLTCVGQFGILPDTVDNKYKEVLQAEKAFWDNRGNNNFSIASGALSTFVNNPYGSSDGIKLFSSEKTPNPTFFKECVELMTKKPTEVMSCTDYQKVIDGMNNGIKQIQAQIDKWTQQSAELMTKKASMEPESLNYFTSMTEGKKIFVETSPIQMVYSSLMLDKYLPNQQYVLETLGVQMTFSNKAAKYMNQIINYVTNFQTADVYYSLGIYLRQMNLHALTDAQGKAQGVLDKEKVRCRSDIARCERAKAELAKIIAEIESDAELTPSQQRELRMTVSGYEFQFNALIRNLGNLYVFLDEMRLNSVNNPDDIEEAFHILVNGTQSEDWPRFLSAFESFVIEGGDNGVVPGGEQQILQSLEATQQNFTTFNQNQQLALQLESSAIQQEWTMVSAALALMNQVFAKLIRRFK